MRILKPLPLLCLVLLFAYSCSPAGEENDPSPDYSKLITGTYAYTTFESGSATGSGNAIIARESNSQIRIGLADGVSFYANKLQQIDQDLVMQVPSQKVDFYNMEAQFNGLSKITRGASVYQGVYFGSKGEMKVSLQLNIDGKSDEILLVLKR